MIFNDLSQFSLTQITKKLNSINISINLAHQTPFPKPKVQLLSFYCFENRWVRIKDYGYFNRCRLVSSLINFSFIRSLVAEAYSNEGGNCYDPVSLFLCDLFRWLKGFNSVKDFCKTLHDPTEGYHYRLYAGISNFNIPSESVFSLFRTHIGESRYNQIFAILVELVQRLGLITASILSHDGTLFHSYAKFKGCNYACKDCSAIKLNNDFISFFRNRILKLLDNHSTIALGKILRCFAQCPKLILPNDVVPPQIHVCDFKLLPYNPELLNPNDQTAKLFGLEDQLKAANLMLVPVHSNIAKIELNLIDNPVYIRCPRVPDDLDAKIGYRRSKSNPNKTEMVFGYQALISTSIEPTTGLEFPIACITQPASTKDGSLFIPIKEQIKTQHPCFKTVIDIADSGFDYTKNYIYSRNQDSIPIFDYNVRAEKLSPPDILARGYDQYGCPLAPCQIACRPNGFDKKNNRLSFVCSKQCLKSYNGIPKPIPNCPYLNSALGFAAHATIDSNPRLQSEIPRGSKHRKIIYNIRTSAERTNSTAKSDLHILEHPPVKNLIRASILAQLACIVVLLKRLLDFIVKITLLLQKSYSTKNPKLLEQLNYRKLPSFLLSILKRE